MRTDSYQDLCSRIFEQAFISSISFGDVASFDNRFMYIDDSNTNHYYTVRGN